MLKILHIEDAKDAQLILKVYLKDVAVLSQVISGELGLGTYNSTFDLVICDGNLPGIHGPDVVTQLKAKNPQVKVVANSSDDKLNNKMIDSGACLKLLKPTSKEEWVKTLLLFK